ncbi:MAG: hypothetical protein O3C22_02185 [Bacteroidetes bacterium]|nr:hypothetical protein [Bacteroidota bacterium]MDA0942923.1 hypothetical protein [Bacteroidota bacterium]MDA1110981.1 hypothetical protein [Bacteroidota bacterium]
MQIKFNHIQDLADARYAASTMADFMGFAIDGPYAIELGKIQEIIGWCSGPKLCMEASSETSITKIKALCDVLPVEALECSYDQGQEWYSLLPSNLEWIISDLPPSYAGPWLAAPKKLETFDPQTAQNLASDSFISLDCQAETQVGLKNYDPWNDFFDALENLI